MCCSWKSSLVLFILTIFGATAVSVWCYGMRALTTLQSQCIATWYEGSLCWLPFPFETQMYCVPAPHSIQNEASSLFILPLMFRCNAPHSCFCQCSFARTTGAFWCGWAVNTWYGKSSTTKATRIRIVCVYKCWLGKHCKIPLAAGNVWLRRAARVLQARRNA